jgi:hypothetical protein
MIGNPVFVAASRLYIRTKKGCGDTPTDSRREIHSLEDVVTVSTDDQSDAGKTPWTKGHPKSLSPSFTIATRCHS